MAERIRDPYRVAWGLPWAAATMASAPNASLAFTPLVSNAIGWIVPTGVDLANGKSRLFCGECYFYQRFCGYRRGASEPVKVCKHRTDHDLDHLDHLILAFFMKCCTRDLPLRAHTGHTLTMCAKRHPEQIPPGKHYLL